MTKHLYKNGKAWLTLAFAATGFAFANHNQASADNQDTNTSAVTSGQSADQSQQGQAATTTANTQQVSSARDNALAKYANQHVNGYIYSPDVSQANGGYNWFEDGHLYTGFRQYMGTYYWFVDGVRQNAGWRQAWGMNYYTDNDGRAVQGHQNIGGQDFDFGNDGTYYLRSSGYLHDGSSQNGGYRWYENGKLYTGFRYYMGTYYWFVDGVRQNAGWRQIWGLTYYTDDSGRAVQGSRIIDGKLYDFGNDGTYYSRPVTGYFWDGSPKNGGYRWYDNGNLYTGFRYYMGTYYWFIDGVRQNAGWRQAWGMTYYTDDNGRAVQGSQYIDGQWYFFGDDGTYYRRFASSDVVNWFYRNYGKITYSMYGSRTGADGTADCSGAMTEALMEAGASKPAYIYNTDSIHDYLRNNGYHLVAENTKTQKQVGDIVIWGRRGQSGGANGHIMIINKEDDANGNGAREISVDYWTNGGYNSAISEHDYNYYAAVDGHPYSYVYRHN
ncbi:hypothetical protein H7198_06405 [Fructobacillus sp. CRL 2054]|uniref:peptidoglycan amidohydrolase family protein n=1 Tax=Fructobacillus sp. CRL 2054 TaxID=2763007 RepID=UPI00237856A0|nr:peptidoglycan amidohydrolase family protein [Fructobacillus sp. CRL 2054]MDD9139233.1 hypothetical protein [Fructobacillus sp. CRL 2054]